MSRENSKTYGADGQLTWENVGGSKNRVWTGPDFDDLHGARRSALGVRDSAFGVQGWALVGAMRGRAPEHAETCPAPSRIPQQYRRIDPERTSRRDPRREDADDDHDQHRQHERLNGWIKDAAASTAGSHDA
jgi:hypothetical protein